MDTKPLSYIGYTGVFTGVSGILQASKEVLRGRLKLPHEATGATMRTMSIQQHHAL